MTKVLDTYLILNILTVLTYRMYENIFNIYVYIYFIPKVQIFVFKGQNNFPENAQENFQNRVHREKVT